MKELLEIYTKSKTFDDMEEIKEALASIQTIENGEDIGFEILARYCYQDDDGNNILVELQIPTLDKFGVPYHEILIAAYGYDGDIEDYTADRGVIYEEFDGNWNTVISQMKELAISSHI